MRNIALLLQAMVLLQPMALLKRITLLKRTPAEPTVDLPVYTPGSGPPPYDVPAQSVNQGPWEWHAGPGPSKRGSMCVKHTDIGRGYGYQEPCPAPKRTAGR